tara:strand:- start:2286 stop:3953 length:1668 start_codon:yes stop_codon:yes gene_type:complete
MPTLTSKQIANSYKQLLQIGNNNTGLTSSLQTVEDGNGNSSALQLTNSIVNINGTFQLNGVALTADASTLNNVADLTGATGLVAVSGGDVYGRTLTAGTGITIGNADGTEGNPTISLSLADTTINVARVSASSGVFNGTVSAGFFVGDGSGLTNVPSLEGGTVKRVEAGTGIKITVDGAVSSSIPVSGTILVSADQNFGTVSVSTALAVTGDLLISGVTAATVNDVAAVSVLTQTNLDSITSINTVVANVSALTSVNAAAITSINTVVDNLDFATSAELATVSAALATSIGNSNTNIAAVSVLTSVNAAAVTSINTVVAAVSALTSVNTAAVTSINTVITDLSSTFATSINNRTTAITSINTVVNAVSVLTSVNSAAITSINSILGDGSNFATSAELATVSSALATSIANHLPLAGGTLTGTVSGTDFYVSAVAIGVDALLGKDLRIGTAAVADIVSLTDAASIAIDFNTGQNFAITLAGNRTLENPTNCVAGQVGSIFIVQDGTGTRTLAYGSSWDFPDGTAPVISTSINSVDRLDYIVHTSTDVHAVITKAYS